MPPPPPPPQKPSTERRHLGANYGRSRGARHPACTGSPQPRCTHPTHPAGHHSGQSPPEPQRLPGPGRQPGPCRCGSTCAAGRGLSGRVPLARLPARSLLQLPPHRRARLHRLALRRPRSAGGRGPGTLLRSQCGYGPPARPPETLHWSFSPAPRPRLPRPSAPPSRNPSTALHPKPRLLRSRPPRSPSPGPAPPEAPPSRGPEVCSPRWQLVWRAVEVWWLLPGGLTLGSPGGYGFNRN